MVNVTIVNDGDERVVTVRAPEPLLSRLHVIPRDDLAALGDLMKDALRQAGGERIDVRVIARPPDGP